MLINAENDINENINKQILFLKLHQVVLDEDNYKSQLLS